MKISFYKGCYSRHLSFEGDGYDLHLSSEQPTEVWLHALPELKVLMNLLIDKAALENGGLHQFYRYFVENEYIDHDVEQINYDLPVKESHEEVVKRIKDFVENVELKEKDIRYSLEEMFKELISYFHTENEDSFDHDCDQCGDHNYELVINF